MRVRILATVPVVLLLAGDARAQDPPEPPEIEAPTVMSPAQEIPAPPIVVQPRRAEQSKTPAQNVRLEIAVTAGEGPDAPAVFEAAYVLATGRPHTLTARQDIPIQGGWRSIGLSVQRVEIALERKKLVVSTHLTVTLPPPGAANAPDTGASRPMPPEFQQQFSAVLESGKRTTVSTVRLPSIEGTVGVHLTATVLPN